MSPPGIKRGARGDRIKPLQTGIDRIVARQGFPWRKVPIDGVAGDATFRSAHLALWLMGASDEQLRKVLKGHLTNRAYELLIDAVDHPAAMKKRQAERRSEAKKLIAEHKRSNEVDAEGWAKYVSPDGVEWRVAGWMVGAAVGPDGTRTNWLKKSVEKGWSGELYSGGRTPAYSRSLCENMCHAPSCPGLCAGEASNHSQTGPPNWGAIDVQDYEKFGRIQREIGSPLKNELPLDHPHYSFTGR